MPESKAWIFVHKLSALYAQKIFTEGNEENEGCANPSFSPHLPKNHESKIKQQCEAPSLASLPSVKNSLFTDFISVSFGTA